MIDVQAKSKDKKDKTREVLETQLSCALPKTAAPAGCVRIISRELQRLTSPSKLEGGEDKASEKKAILRERRVGQGRRSSARLVEAIWRQTCRFYVACVGVLVVVEFAAT